MLFGEEKVMLMTAGKYALEDLYIGMRANAEQLSEIYNKYMILLYEDMESQTGKLVYCKDTQDQDYDQWFMQPKPITPIYHDKDELEDMAVYDESVY